MLTVFAWIPKSSEIDNVTLLTVFAWILKSSEIDNVTLMTVFAFKRYKMYG